MSLRFSPYQLVLIVPIVALWLGILWQRDTRDLVRQHLRVMLSPSQKYSYPNLDLSRAEDCIVMGEVDPDKNRKVLDQYPQDAALLAVYVRESVGKLELHDRKDGALETSLDLAPLPNWGVTTDSFKNAPWGISRSVTTREQIDYCLGLIKRGQRLEPQNTFWDWMEMCVLLVARRDGEVEGVLRCAASKTDFNDHVSDEVLAHRQVWSRETFDTLARVLALSGPQYRHLTQMRLTTRFLAQRTMGLRLQGREKEALEHGLRVIRLARVMRLKASTPWVSQAGADYEGIAITRADVPLDKRPFSIYDGSSVMGFTNRRASLGKLASDSRSLLFLAEKLSPQAAKEIATEWQNLARWGSVSSGNFFHDLISESTAERVGWVQRLALYLSMSLPVALAFWLGTTALKIRLKEEFRLSPLWGVLIGGVWWGGLFLWEFLPSNTLLFSARFLHGIGFRGQIFDSPSEALYFSDSWVTTPLLLAGGATLWLLWFAMWQKTPSLPPRTRPQVQDWEEDALESFPFQMLERINIVLRWCGLRGIPMLVFMGSWVSLSLFIMTRSIPFERERFGVLVHLLCLFALLVVVPLLAIGVYRLGECYPQITISRFGGRAHALLEGYVVAALLVLPILLFFQNRMQQDFNRQFAPIERGQMVVAIQKMRGVPMK